MPSNTVTANSIVLGRGEVYFDRYTAGTMTRNGERFLGNCTSFELQIEDETRDKYSSAEATSPLIKTVNVRRTPTLKIALDEYDEHNVALAFMGTPADYLVTGAAVVDEVPPTAVVKKGYGSWWARFLRPLRAGR